MAVAEYIEKGRLIDFFKDTYGGGIEENTVVWYQDVVCNIAGTPAADVAPVVHAMPLLIFDDPFSGRRFTTCSNCNGKIGPKDRYCKHCGAKMDDPKGD